MNQVIISDVIDKDITLKASRSRVWRALTDHEEFGAWFGARLDGPFIVGAPSRGMMGCDAEKSMRWSAEVVAIEPESRFAIAWHPYSGDADADYSQEPPTLIEFTLEETSGGTRLRVRESGFNRLAPERRDIAFESHSKGWTMQLENIARHVEQNG